MNLEHREYDPVKAHEYYVLNRKLKGRPPKTDRVSQFSPTLSRIIRDGKSFIDAGQLFANRLFGKSVESKPNLTRTKSGAIDYGAPEAGNWPKNYLR